MKNILLGALYISSEGFITILAIEKDITWSTFAFLSFVIVLLALGLIIQMTTAKDRQLQKNNDEALKEMKKRAIMRQWITTKVN